MQNSKNQVLIEHEIYLWRDYNNPIAGVSGTVGHGGKVKLIKREGIHALVATNSKKGWVTEDLIKEYK